MPRYDFAIGLKSRNRAVIRDAERWELNTDKLVGIVDSRYAGPEGTRPINLAKLPGLIGETVNSHIVPKKSSHNTEVVDGLRFCDVRPGKINDRVHAIPVKKPVRTGEIDKGNIVADNHTGVVYGGSFSFQRPGDMKGRKHTVR